MTTLSPTISTPSSAKRDMEEWRVPGLALAVTRRGARDWVKAYGLRDVEAGLPVTADARFHPLLGPHPPRRSASRCWSMTRASLANPSVRDYLPEFACTTHSRRSMSLLCTALPQYPDCRVMIGSGCPPTFRALRCSRRYVISTRAKTLARPIDLCDLGYVAGTMVAEPNFRPDVGGFHAGADHEAAWHGPYRLFGRGLGARPPTVRAPISCTTRRKQGRRAPARAALAVADTPAGGINVAASMARYGAGLPRRQQDRQAPPLISSARLKALYEPRACWKVSVRRNR